MECEKRCGVLVVFCAAAAVMVALHSPLAFSVAVLFLFTAAASALLPRRLPVDTPRRLVVLKGQPRRLPERDAPALRFRKKAVVGRAWVELDRAALRHNVRTLQAMLPPGCALMPVLKADAYGHGAVWIGRELNALGLSSFCVATAAEGAALRKGGVEGEILVLGYTPPEQFGLLCRSRLMQTVTDSGYAKQLAGYGKRLEVQIAVDTGMRRLGVRCEQVEEIAWIFSSKRLNVKGVFTHLSAADIKNADAAAFTRRQAEHFENAVQRLRDLGCKIPKAHMLNSSALLRYPELAGDCARVGIALYGVLATREESDDCPVPLEPVLSLKARVAQVKTIRRGETAGYGLAYTAPRDGKLAVLSIGYADGLPRALSCGRGKALINGYEAPVVGRICMDQTLVDATEIPNIQCGDVAVLIGRSGALRLTACDVAASAETISNEILSRMGTRLERVVKR